VPAHASERSGKPTDAQAVVCDPLCHQGTTTTK
jgi:hypothetical protein